MDRPRPAALLRRAAIAVALGVVCYGIYLLTSISVTTDMRTGQEHLNGQADSTPLVAPLLLLLGGGGALAVLLSSRGERP